MHLNTVDKNKLRRMIEEKVVNIPHGKRIKIEKNILEELLFHKEKSNKGILAKFIIWFGDFLTKIDLSEVSFEDVVWDITHANDFKSNPYRSVNKIVLNNTNCHIDFSTSYEYKNKIREKYSISNCELENVNLIGFDIFNNIENCNLKNTNIVFSKGNYNKNITNCNLEGNNLFGTTIHLTQLLGCSMEGTLTFSNIKNTNINIIYNYKRPSNYYEKLKTLRELETKDGRNDSELRTYNNLKYELREYIGLDKLGKRLGEKIKNGELVGCYVNGKYIKSEELKNMNRNVMIEKLKNEKEELINSLERSIDDQVLKLRNNKSSS